MGFVKKACTTAQLEIPEGYQKEAELKFHHEITSLVERCSIPSLHVINIDETPLKYAPVSSRIMATKSSKHVHVASSSYKQVITGTFGIALSNKLIDNKQTHAINLWRKNCSELAEILIH